MLKMLRIYFDSRLRRACPRHFKGTAFAEKKVIPS